MLKTSFIPHTENKPKWFDNATVYKPSAEALICLNCDLPICKGITCKRYSEEKKKLQRKN